MKQILTTIILNYFRALARLQLQKNRRAVIIGITGSVGKTSTSQAIVRILRTRGRVKTSHEANSESGIPLNILGLRPIDYSVLDWLRLAVLSPLMLLFNWERFDYYVVEMGIDSPDAPKNMAYLLSIIHPHVGVVLNSGLVHAAAFDYLVKDQDPIRRLTKLRQAIAKEKMTLAHSLDKTGISVFNLDQKELVKYRPGITARQITFGKSASANLRIISTSIGKNGFKLVFSYQAQTDTLILKDIFPTGFAYTFASAITTAAAVGVPVTQSLKALANYRAPAGRLRIFPGLSGSTILDSSYNASPDVTLEALELLKKLAGHAHKIAVIGDMRELGSSAKLAHKNLADWATLYADEVLLFGPLTLTHTLPVLVSRHFPARHFTTMSKLIEYLRQTVRPRSWVLVKGSQNGILLERAVAAILNNPDDLKLLCRRGHYWDSVRAKTS